MAWNPKGGPWGTGGGGGGPWSSGPTPTPQPDLEDLLRRGQERVKRLVPGPFGGIRIIALLVVGAIVLWLLTGLYRVQPGEQGVELLFGRFVRVTTPGLNYWFPNPIGTVYTPNVEETKQITIGYRSAPEGSRGGNQFRDVPPESLMLTADQNIIDVDFVVQWRIKDAAQYLFNLRDPEGTVKLAAESAIREIMGQTTLEDALTAKRQEVDQRTKELLQQILDDYQAGIYIAEVKQQKVDPPAEVIDAFNDVQRARQDQERLVNEALAYRNDIVPRAKGDAERIIQEAKGYQERVVLDAKGESSRFLSVLDAYRTGKDVTTRRLYLERLQQLLSTTPKIIVDEKAGSQGVVPYLPLSELRPTTKPEAGK